MADSKKSFRVAKIHAGIIAQRKSAGLQRWEAHKDKVAPTKLGKKVIRAMRMPYPEIAEDGKGNPVGFVIYGDDNGSRQENHRNASGEIIPGTYPICRHLPSDENEAAEEVARQPDFLKREPPWVEKERQRQYRRQALKAA